VPSKETKTFTVEETKADTTRIALTNLSSDAIETFVKSNALTPELEQAMRKILAQKNAIAKIDADLKSKESAITDIVQDQNRLRENMKSLKGTPEEKSLAQRYTTELNDQETQLATLRQERATLQANRKQAQQELDSSIEQMTIDPAAI
jgi:septal ring factor EnvC (AmiA/AmiB activator)